MKKKSRKELQEEVDSFKIKLIELENLVKEITARLKQNDENKDVIETKIDSIETKTRENDIKIKYNANVIDDKHQQVYSTKKCYICDETFVKNNELETHLRNHTEANKFKCNLLFGKLFFLKWRI